MSRTPRQKRNTQRVITRYYPTGFTTGTTLSDAQRARIIRPDDGYKKPAVWKSIACILLVLGFFAGATIMVVHFSHTIVDMNQRTIAHETQICEIHGGTYTPRAPGLTTTSRCVSPEGYKINH